ncbi:hypothetical protein ABIE51_003406 [Lysobacter sp. OAE881]
MQVELLDFDMRRQCVALERLHVRQSREIRAEMTLDERLHEAAFESLSAAGRIERQRGVQVQRARGVVLDARIQRVEEPVRLAEAKRRADVQRAGDALEQEIGRGIDRIEGEGSGAGFHGGSLT